MEDAFKHLEWNYQGLNVNGKYMLHLRFADDIVIMAESREDLNRMLFDLQKVSKRSAKRWTAHLGTDDLVREVRRKARGSGYWKFKLEAYVLQWSSTG
ncbi:unnamed protein product [Pieris macdunnoughi]|nr:unnamed protein product [Pieris macdunnoughi]